MGLHMPWSDIDLFVRLPKDPAFDSLDLLAEVEALLAVR